MVKFLRKEDRFIVVEKKIVRCAYGAKVARRCEGAAKVCGFWCCYQGAFDVCRGEYEEEKRKEVKK